MRKEEGEFHPSVVNFSSNANGGGVIAPPVVDFGRNKDGGGRNSMNAGINFGISSAV
jgi:hypothetical protein